MLKVVQGHRPSRPSSGLSEALWDLLVATWAEQFAQKPRKRPPIHTVLSRLGECVDHWGKSITPLIPEDWENIGLCRMSPNPFGSLFMSFLQVVTAISQLRRVIFTIELVILSLTRRSHGLVALGQTSRFSHLD